MEFVNGKDDIPYIYGKNSKILWLVAEPPLWKIWKSNGIMKFPTYGKIQFMFQTTSQDFNSFMHSMKLYESQLLSNLSTLNLKYAL